MDRDAVAKECLKIERRGGSVHEYLRSLGVISPRGTWYRLQKENLHRSKTQIREDGQKDMYFENQNEMLDAVIAEIQAKRDPLALLKERGYKAPAQTYSDIKNFAKRYAPEKAVQFPENLKEWKKAIAAGMAEKKAEETKPARTETAKITAPLMYDGFTVTAIRGRLGHYSYVEDSTGRRFIDFDSNNAEYVSMTVEQWQDFMVELQHAAQVLGVDLAMGNMKKAGTEGRQ